MRKIAAILTLLVLAFVLTGCLESSDSQTRIEQEKLLKEGVAQAGLPNITNFFEKKTLKKILEMRDDPDLTTYVYMQSLNGKFIYLGRAVGYGVPFSTQYTNPEKTTGAGYSLPQADPNGLFAPSSSSATWVLLINEETNETEIVYVEPLITVTQTKLPKRLIEEWSLPENY